MCPKFDDLQTREAEISTSVSEVWRSSDNGWHIHRECVRSLMIFRQGNAKSARVCPKFGDLQTREGEISARVSEVWASSDKVMRNQCECVRSLDIFRQGKLKSVRVCPKFGDLQTREREISSSVSEVWGSSDKGRRNQREGVRSLRIFRLWNAESVQGCPKFVNLQTTVGIFTARVSEV